jgi:hypothetical protein
MITPKQAYEAAKVLWPGIVTIKKWKDVGWTSDAPARVWDQVIDWGDTDQYPLPEPEWVDAVFPQDVGKEGRFGTYGKNGWAHGIIRGQLGNGKWIGADYEWRFCQVRKVKT